MSVTAVFLSGSILHLRAGDADWKTRLVTNLPKTWESIRPFCSNLEGTFTETYHLADERAKNDQIRRVRFLIKGESIRYEEIINRTNWNNKTVIGWNSKYGFALNAESDGNYSVVQLKQNSESDKVKRTEGAYNRVLAAAWAPWVWSNGTLADAIKQPWFEVVSVTPHDVSGKTMVRLEFKSKEPNHRDPDHPDRMHASGWFLLDPTDYWVIHESHVNLWHGPVVTRIQYGERVNGYPLRHRTIRTAGISQYIWEIETVSHRDADDSEFTLSSFGLPEPNFTPRRFGNWIMLLTLAIVFAVLAFLLRRVLRKRSAA
ncbi:MAG: hypothetical protein ACYC3I_11620 [Gemmataceae bacterium]